MPYQSNSRLADLILRRGDIAAQAELQRGRAWGDAWRGVGDAAQRSLSSLIEYQQDAPRREFEQEQRGAWREDRAAAEEEKTASRRIGELMQASEGEDGHVDRHVFMARVRQAGLSAYLKPALTLLEQYDPVPKPAEPFTLSEGQRRYDPGGREIAASAPKPPEAYTLTPGARRMSPAGEMIAEAPLAQRAPVSVAPGGRLVDPVSGRVVAEGAPQREPQWPAPSFQAKEVLNDEGKAVMANYNARTGVTTDAATGQPIRNPRPVPSAMETQDARKFKQAGPILSAVSELSEKINTQAGLIAKISGGVEKVKAQANYNDDVAEYEALIQGFTPLVARALGHTGVLTQQDVDSVRMLFPKPGDSKSLRDRKVARINSIIGELETGAGGTPPGDGKVNTALTELERRRKARGP